MGGSVVGPAPAFIEVARKTVDSVVSEAVYSVDEAASLFCWLSIFTNNRKEGGVLHAEDDPVGSAAVVDFDEAVDPAYPSSVEA